jgi:alkylation response protein AidB-like acyl-CoA dehydrogenase
LTAAAPRTPEPDSGSTSAAFRQEVRSWLEANAPDHLRGVRVPRRPVGRLAADLAAWGDLLASAGLLCVSWPREYGGRGLRAVEVAVLEEEFRRADVPRITRGMGETLVGPSIIAHGTDEQKAYFLPRIIDGTDKYCQGFSEPDAGSDLASLSTRGYVDGDEVVVTGQKVWTSWYWDATMLFCLCRTDSEAPKHRGLSYILIPIGSADGKANGVEFRPLRQLTGDSHFAETFLTEARAPLFNVIGSLNGGWRVAMTTLRNERGGRAITQHLSFEKQFWQLIDEVRARQLSTDPVVRQFLAWAFTKVSILRFQGQRVASALSSGQEPGRYGEPSLNKILWSEYQQCLAEEAVRLIGPSSTIVAEDYGLDIWQQTFLTSRSDTIWGGTAQIQRNIVAERVLGLPKDPTQ